MAKKTKTTSLSDVREIAWKLIRGGKDALSDEEYNYLNEYYASNDDFRKWFDKNAANSKRQAVSQRGGSRVGGSSGSAARDDTFDRYGFTALPGISTSVSDRGGFGSNRIVSPGGFKESGQDVDSMIRRSGKRTNQESGRNTAEIYDDGTSKAFGGRRRTKAETKAIIRRGLSGATMSLEDQSIYDRFMALREEKAAAKLESATARQAAMQNAKTRADRLLLLGLPMDSEMSDMQLADLIERRNERLKTDEDVYRQGEMKRIETDEAIRRAAAIEDAKRIAAENDNAAFNRHYGVDDGITLSQKDKDDISAGRKYWGADRKAVKELMDEYDAIEERYLNGEISDSDFGVLSDSITDKIDSLSKRLRDNPEEQRTVEQRVGDLYTDKQGRIWGKDGVDGVKLVYTPKEEKEKPITYNGMTFEDIFNKTPQTEEVQQTYPDGKPMFGQTKKRNRTMAERNQEALDFMRSQGIEFGKPSDRLRSVGSWNPGDPCPVCGAALDENGYCGKCGYNANYNASMIGDGGNPPPEEQPAADGEVYEAPDAEAATPTSALKKSYL